MTNQTKIAIDNGNGQGKGAIYLPDQQKPYTWKIPNGFRYGEPERELDQNTLTEKPAKSFYIETPEGNVYFGQDILRSGVIRRLNDHKYRPEYMKVMFSGLMAQLARSKKKLNLDSLGVITVNAGMPSKPFNDKNIRIKTRKAYEKVFGKQPAPWYVKGEGFNTFRLTTRFGTLFPEAAKVASSVDARGYELVLVGDIGFGTNDWVLYCPKIRDVLSVSTKENGLRQFFHQHSVKTEDSLELQYMLGKGDTRLTDVYFQVIWNNLYAVTSAFSSAKIKIVLIGGTKLISDDMLSELKSNYKGISLGDEYNNVLSFLGGIDG